MGRNKQIDKPLTIEMQYNIDVNNLINNLPQNAQAAAEIMNTFDPNKFAEVVNFAQAANGGRPI